VEQNCIHYSTCAKKQTKTHKIANTALKFHALEYIGRWGLSTLIKVTINQNGQFVFFMEYCSIIYYKGFIRAHHCFIFLTIILNQNNFPSLWWCGRGNLSLTWDPPIANNHPINFTESILLYHNKEEKIIATSFLMATLSMFKLFFLCFTPTEMNTFGQILSLSMLYTLDYSSYMGGLETAIPQGSGFQFEPWRLNFECL